MNEPPSMLIMVFAIDLNEIWKTGRFRHARPPIAKQGMGIGKVEQNFCLHCLLPFSANPYFMTAVAENSARKSYRKFKVREVRWGKVGYHFQL